MPSRQPAEKRIGSPPRQVECEQAQRLRPAGKQGRLKDSGERHKERFVLERFLVRNGASRARTGDLLGAIQALSQLSYSPARRVAGGK